MAKCKERLCYADSDCRHGLCGKHCRNHSVQGYHSVRSTPRNGEPHLGVEIEVEFATAAHIQRVCGIPVEEDGSLENGIEAKLCGPWPRILTRTNTLLAYLQKRGARISQRCGLHVHLDTRHAHYERVRELLTMARATNPDWMRLVPPSRRCQHERGRESASCRHYVTPVLYGEDRYEWLNRRRTTLECRLHPGTLNAHKMTGWLTAMNWLLVRLHDHERPIPQTFAALWQDAPVVARDYIQARLDSGGVLSDNALDRYSADVGEEQPMARTPEPEPEDDVDDGVEEPDPDIESPLACGCHCENCHSEAISNPESGCYVSSSREESA